MLKGVHFGKFCVCLFVCVFLFCLFVVLIKTLTVCFQAKQVYRDSNGQQQVLPLDSIFRRSLPEWNRFETQTIKSPYEHFLYIKTSNCS